MSTSRRQSQGDAWFTPERVTLSVLAAATAIVFYLCYRLVEPFVPALAWALAIAVVAYPFHAWLERRLKYKSLVAGLTVLAVTLTVLAPAALLVHHATNEAAASAETFRNLLSEGTLRSKIEKNEMAGAAMRWIERTICWIDAEVWSTLAARASAFLARCCI